MRRERDRKFSDCARVAEQTQWRPMGWRQCLQGVLVALILSSISAVARPADELGWELRFPSGFGLRLSGGAASALHMATPRCTNAAMQTVACGGPEPERTIVVLTSAFGYAF
jgi:hypothetical protein